MAAILTTLATILPVYTLALGLASNAHAIAGRIPQLFYSVALFIGAILEYVILTALLLPIAAGQDLLSPLGQYVVAQISITYVGASGLLLAVLYAFGRRPK